MGSNMAENHPIAFRFALQAKERGATLIHVDPRFTRTSALCDIYAPLRPGSDIAFLVLNKMPKSLHTKAKRALQEIWMAETKKDAVAALEALFRPGAGSLSKPTRSSTRERPIA